MGRGANGSLSYNVFLSKSNSTNLSIYPSIYLLTYSKMFINIMIDGMKAPMVCINTITNPPYQSIYLSIYLYFLNFLFSLCFFKILSLSVIMSFCINITHLYLSYLQQLLWFWLYIQQASPELGGATIIMSDVGPGCTQNVSHPWICRT